MEIFHIMIINVQQSEYVRAKNPKSHAGYVIYYSFKMLMYRNIHLYILE